MVFGRGLLPADLKETMGEQATVCEKAVVVRRMNYRISRTAGAFASSRVAATLGLLHILDYAYTNVPFGAHGELLHQSDGLHP